MKLSPLEIVRMVNDGVLLWEQVGGLLQNALESGKDVTMEDVDDASDETGDALIELRDAIEAKKARDAG